MERVGNRFENRSAAVSEPAIRAGPLQRRADLLQRNLRLDLEPDRRWDVRLFTTSLIVSPLARQMEPIGNRQAGMMVGIDSLT
jgi:hypothetical protein